MKPAIETLSYQGSGLHDKITEAVISLRADGSYTTKAINESLFSEYVRIRTGINVDLKITTDRSIAGNALVYLPRITNDHPFVKLYGIKILANSDGQYITRLKDCRNYATIDLENCKVGGVFSEVKCSIVISKDLIADEEMTSQEIAAILIHEIGHVFTYFQFTDMMTVGGFVSILTAREYAGIKDPSKKRYVVENAADVLGVDSETVEKTLSAPKDNDVLLLREFITGTFFNTSNPWYDLRNIEQLADQFCAKHGCGKHLATALVKMYKRYGHPSSSFFIHMMSEIVNLCNLLMAIIIPVSYMAATPASIIIGIGLGVFYFLILNTPQIKIYDDPEARLKFIRKTLTQDLKNSAYKADKEQQKRIMDDITAVDNAMKGIKDRKPFYVLVWESIPGLFNTIAKQEKAAKELESLMYNDLHYQSSLFEFHNH